MKTLLIVTGGLGSGGLERISCFVANKFVEKGWRVVIATLLSRETKESVFQLLNQDVVVIPFPKSYEPVLHKKKAIPTWLKMISRITKEYCPDSILAMTFKVGSLVSFAAPRYAKRVVVREISDPKSKVRNQFVNWITEVMCRKCKGIIFQTNWERACYHKWIQRKGRVIPNPVSISLDSRGTYSKRRFFTLSRLLVNQKRQDVLISGFKNFHKSHPDYSLDIFGKGEDESLIRKMIEEAGAADYINIVPPVPNVHSIVKDYRGFVMTSDYEGMSNALLECYSLGIPCISSDWPGVEDIVTHEFDGLLYRRQNIEELSECLKRLADDDKLCTKLAKNALKGAARFEQEMIITEYCEMIEHE